ncbi:MAG: zinc-ribbon domain-containing protein [Pseudomonadota bacterium]
MRLICPNCGATYEVPDSVIPAEGRDVQCSNCGTSWFFDPTAIAVEDAQPGEAEAAPQIPESPMPIASPEPSVATVPEPVEAEAPGEVTMQPTPIASPPISRPPPAPAPGTDMAPSPAPAEDTAPRRRPLEGAVADVLREEAAFEAKARAEEAGLEFQADLPLATPPAPSRPEVNEEAIAAAVASSRRDLLPDIDEINSTLRATSEREAAGDAPVDEVVRVQRHRRGFRAGFGLACVVLAGLAGLYSYADLVAARVPALEGALAIYVELVTGLRIWLQDAVARLADRIEA